MPDEKNPLPQHLRHAFEATTNRYEDLAPGAVARLRTYTAKLYESRLIRTADEMAAGLVAFLEGQDHAEAIERGDPEEIRAADPKAYFFNDPRKS